MRWELWSEAFLRTLACQYLKLILLLRSLHVFIVTLSPQLCVGAWLMPYHHPIHLFPPISFNHSWTSTKIRTIILSRCFTLLPSMPSLHFPTAELRWKRIASRWEFLANYTTRRPTAKCAGLREHVLPGRIKPIALYTKFEETSVLCGGQQRFRPTS